MMADTDPDDTLTELLNDAETRSAIQQINSNKDETTDKKDRQAEMDIFASGNNISKKHL